MPSIYSLIQLLLPWEAAVVYKKWESLSSHLNASQDEQLHKAFYKIMNSSSKHKECFTKLKKKQQHHDVFIPSEHCKYKFCKKKKKKKMQQWTNVYQQINHTSQINSTTESDPWGILQAIWFTEETKLIIPQIHQNLIFNYQDHIFSQSTTEKKIPKLNQTTESQNFSD